MRTADLQVARRDALSHAIRDAPREACGLFVTAADGLVTYWPCRNLAQDEADGQPAQDFILDPEDYRSASRAGTIVAVVHSHPDGFPLPTQADLASCELWGVPWHIVSPHLGDGEGLWHAFEPSGFRAPLLGRQWSWGVHDCWGLVRDWYADHGMEIKDFVRPVDPNEFLRKPLFAELFREAGFGAVDDEIRPGDCALMSIGRSHGLNHVGVFTEELRLLHHLQGRLSVADFYGEGLRKATGLIVRHLACDSLKFPS